MIRPRMVLFLLVLMVQPASAHAAGTPARVAVFCQAANADQGASGRAHTEDAFLNAGFDVVEPTLGGEAEFLVAMKVTCKTLPSEGGRQYCSATVRYRVFDVPAAEVVTAGSARDTGWGTTADEATDTAVKYAAVQAVRDVSGKLKERIALYADYAVVLSIEIHDVQGDAISQDLAGRLGKVEGVGLVHRQRTASGTWELRLFSRVDTQVISPRVESVLAGMGMAGDARQADRFVLVGQDLRVRAAGGKSTTIACLAVANRTGRADLDSWASGLADLVQQELLARPAFRVVERRQVRDVLAEGDVARILADDEAARRRVGELAGADQLVIGELTADPGGELILALRYVSVADGHLVQLIRVRGDAADTGAFETQIRQAVRTPPNSLPADMLNPW